MSNLITKRLSHLFDNFAVSCDHAENDSHLRLKSQTGDQVQRIENQLQVIFQALPPVINVNFSVDHLQRINSRPYEVS